MRRKLFKTSILVVFFVLSSTLAAQVAIGVDEAPSKGALLQLKKVEDSISKGGENSTKGLGLPRVELQSYTSLKMSKNGDDHASEREMHTGLMVYNISKEKCNPDIPEQGLYVWNGAKWINLLNSAIITVDNTTSKSGYDAWGGKTIRHAQKNDNNSNVIYEEFYSADFGQAGRWMTTNLIAYRYDLDTTPVSDFYKGGDISVTENNGALSLHPADISAPKNKARYAYPGKSRTITNNENPSDEFTANRHLGLLYTWDAATAGKGGSTGMGNVYKVGGISNEWGFKDEKRNQGICPKGWHLPSDYEWTELEQEIIKNTSMYAEVADINSTGSGANWVDQSTAGSDIVYRGTHGEAMRSACYFSGASKSIGHNGFNVLPAGFVINGKVRDYAQNGRFWCNSAIHGDVGHNAASRQVGTQSLGIGRGVNARDYLNSVRCKKD